MNRLLIIGTIAVFGMSFHVLQLSAQVRLDNDMIDRITQRTYEIEQDVIEWRRHLHANPELSNREYETSKYVEAHLNALGLEVHTGIAVTGLVGVLRGAKEGPVVGLRADMDALPVVERVDLPFASTVMSTYLGEEVGVMHACGHDTHVAMLMGAAEILTEMRDEIPGTVVFIFQPAEEGAPPGEEGGAKLMVKEGLVDRFDLDVIFGLHISSGLDVGRINYKPGGFLAASDRFVITVKGKQTHGSTPWSGVDPITVSAQIIQGLNNIVSRQTELTKEAAVISVGKIDGGVRNNIIPEQCQMIGTIRTLDSDMQKEIHRRIRTTVTNIAEASGATADVDIQIGYPVTYNDPALLQATIPVLYEIAGEDNVRLTHAITGAEDFSFFANEVPGVFLFLGGKPIDMPMNEIAPHHTPDFYIDESGMALGVRALCGMTLNYMAAN